MKILVIGDSCTDIFIYGDIHRIAPEAPVPIIKPLHTKKNLGMASNVAANLKALGADVDIITNKNHIKKIRYVDDRYNQMVLRVDENDKCDRIKDFAFLHDLEDGLYDAVIISDYCKGFLSEKDINYIAMYHNTVFLDTKKYLGEWCDNISFIKINNSEHMKNFDDIPKYSGLHDKLIITQGSKGCLYKDKIYPTQEVPVKDVSGAGDTFIAGLVYEYVKSKDISNAIDFAQKCTTIVVQKTGVATI